MLLSELIGVLNIKTVVGNTDKEIDSIIYDSRKFSREALFIAIKGELSDGHNYIDELIEKGIEAIICEDMPCKRWVETGATFIVVENSRLALAQVSKKWYNNPFINMKVMGITGTNGKTTISFLLKSILEAAGFKTGVIGTTGIYIDHDFLPATHTTPESLEIFAYIDQMRKKGVEIVILEVSSHALKQGRVSSIKFDAAIFTNLTHDHLDFHKSINDYARAKKMLFEMLSKESIAIVNGDDEYSKYMTDGILTKNIYKVGRKANNDIIISDEKLHLTSTEFKLSYSDGKSLKINTSLTGRFNIDNCSLSAVLASHWGISRRIIAEALKDSKGAPGRMQKVSLNNGAVAYVDYAHTPDALEKALDACRQILDVSPGAGRLICVFGCGGDRDKGKRSIMGDIASGLADLVILTDDNPRSEDPSGIIGDIYKGISNSFRSQVETISDRKKAIIHAVNISKENDIIIIAGKGHEKYQIYGGQKLVFDDYEVINNIV